MRSRRARGRSDAPTIEPVVELPGVIPIAEARWRTHVRVAGHVRSLRVELWAGGVATLECTLVDGTGGLTLAFLGRRRVSGINLGTTMTAEGTVVESHGRLALLNPAYELLVPD